ncbi:DEAD/DEAH box helicase [Paenibacillus koleovorans]|uniref:DEAD/DEAH box helicase n=1 Tax=Paenibacillus koleovorans TaxID=121608 RepID=UPI000FD9346F|nr:DEAD/DEAH box helicase [Paenibacillus koleovorans]
MGAIEQAIPDYLIRPTASDYYYGTLEYEEKTDSWVIKGDPAVCQMAKRLFPGAEGRGAGIARFKSNKRTNGDLNWLMMRYPLEVKAAEKWESDYQTAVKHVVKRNQLRVAPSMLEPSSLVFNGQLGGFQKEGVAFLHNNAPTLLADDMGLGKTVEALAWIATVNRYPGLIVVPTSVRIQWASQIKKFIVPQTMSGQIEMFGADPSKMVHIIKGLKPYDLPPAQFYIIHYGLLRGWKQYLPSFGFEFVVFDEIQELRHDGTDKYAAAALLGQSTEEVIGLSGTPIYNYGDEIRNVMNILDYQCLGDKESFSHEWCAGGKVVQKPQLLYQYLKREGLMLRRTKEDVLSELPAKRRVVQEIDSDHGAFSAQMKEVIDLIGQHDRAADHFERGRLKRRIGEEVRRATGVAKAPYVAEFVKMLLDAGEAVVLYGYHHDVYEVWREQLKKYNPVFVTGAETTAQKEASKEAFIQGQSNLIVISLRAAAGIDGLQKRASVCVNGELDWSPGVHSQCEDRLHRIGQQAQVIIYYLVCSDGSDEQMMEALGLKTSQFVGIMGGEAETEVEKELSQIEVGKHLDRIMEQYRSKQREVV